MAKSRHKSNGVKRGAFKKKKMGKGWQRHRKVPGRPEPIDRSATQDEAESKQPQEASAD